eukprot:CAMPEP_0174342140 /NCGR_PEP_ID=MMETSP0810-20121108/25933_1 /TAXON_ID=73025 ORGANISM="Eutreptiella gymnastica-like, Strain CCMP1594" /NCGR_SAMPLE_ID=MMETSP0810 /ASSEMBLY_ACC=CAM_ASM_000659 /LENGTH=71 /DNA_ID=CAMNT_0015464117 /DNA_START=76 /DNA_END=291 /DNA_ORIENTATION=+
MTSRKKRCVVETLKSFQSHTRTQHKHHGTGGTAVGREVLNGKMPHGTEAQRDGGQHKRLLQHYTTIARALS